MQIDETGLKRLQSVCLEFILEIDRVCRKNNIEYTLEGGNRSSKRARIP